MTQTVSPDDDHDALETCIVKNKNKYIEKKCASRWSFTKNLKLNMRPTDTRYEVKREKIKRILISLSLFNLGNGSNITLTSTVCEVTVLV